MSYGQQQLTPPQSQPQGQQQTQFQSPLQAQQQPPPQTPLQSQLMTPAQPPPQTPPQSQLLTPAQPPPQTPPQSPPETASESTSEETPTEAPTIGLPKMVGIGILICVIMLFLGTLLTAGALYIKDDIDLQRNLLATTVLVGGIGLFILGLFASIAFLGKKNLSEHQLKLLVILLAITIFALAILIR